MTKNRTPAAKATALRDQAIEDAAFNLTCPYCGSKYRETCRRPNGEQLTEGFHKARLKFAADIKGM